MRKAQAARNPEILKSQCPSTSTAHNQSTVYFEKSCLMPELEHKRKDKAKHHYHQHPHEDAEVGEGGADGVCELLGARRHLF